MKKVNLIQKEYIKKYSWLIPLFILFLFFSYTRFYNLGNRTIFGWDQERDAFQIYDLLKNHKLFLIGPRVLSDTGFFLGPYYTYLLAPFYLITKFDPIAIVYFIIFIQFLFFFSFWFIFQKIFSELITFFSLLLYTLNPLMIRYDSIAWNPIMIPFCAVLIYGFMYKLYKSKYEKNILFIFLGILTGITFHFHVQGIFLFLQVISFFIILKKSYSLKIKIVSLILLGFLSTFITIFLFDLRHNFLNIKLIIDLISSKGLEKDIFSFTPVLHNFVNWQGLFFIRSELLTLSLYIIFLTIIIFVSKRQKGFIRYFNISYALLMLFVIIGFMIYGKRPSEYYFNILIIGGLILISQSLNYVYSLLNNKVILFLCLLIIAFFSIKNIPQLLKVDQVQGLYSKQRVTKYALENTKKCNIVLHKEIELGFDTGFSYLFEYQKPNVGLNCSKIVRIAYPPKKDDKSIGKYGVLIINK